MRALDFFAIQMNVVNDMIVDHKERHPRGKPVQKGISSHTLRSVVVFSVAALDAYMFKRTVEVFRNLVIYKKTITKQSFDLLSAGFGKEKDQMHNFVSVLIKDGPSASLPKRMEYALGKRTFQNPSQLDEAFAIMNITDPWTKIQSEFYASFYKHKGGPRPKIKKFITDLVGRRHAIVHEGDMYFSDKHHAKFKPIGRSEVKEYVKKLIGFVGAVDKITENESRN